MHRAPSLLTKQKNPSWLTQKWPVFKRLALAGFGRSVTRNVRLYESSLQTLVVTQEVTHAYDALNQWVTRTVNPDGEQGSAAIEQTVFVHEGGQIVSSNVPRQGSRRAVARGLDVASWNGAGHNATRPKRATYAGEHLVGHVTSWWKRRLRDMGSTMKLMDAIRQLDSLDENGTIYAAAPWSAMSEVIVAEEPAPGLEPPEARARGLTYFLEVFIAKDVLAGFVSDRGGRASDEEKCERLIKYAIDDA